MHKSFKEQSIFDFLIQLSSASSTPGGGTVAAIGGACAAGLVMMVAQVTIGKKGYEKDWGRAKEMLLEAEKYRDALLRLADEDSAAFEEVIQAYTLPKDDMQRKEKIKDALQKAIEVPRSVAGFCEKLSILAREIGRIGNTNAFSDAKSAEYFSLAAKNSAMENVKINILAYDAI